MKNIKNEKKYKNSLLESKDKSHSISNLWCGKDSNFMSKSNKFKNQNGITLIVLVITIILIIILAGVTLNLVLGESGVISRAREQQEKQDIVRILEELEVKKGAVGIDNSNIVKLDKYIDYIKSQKTIDDADIIERYATEALIVVEDKYVYLLEEEENGNLKITYNGQIKDLQPTIELKAITNTTNAIKVEVIVKQINGGKIEYYLKAEDQSDYELKQTTSDTIYKYENLEQNKKYNVKIVVVSGNGKTAEILVDRTVGQVEGLTNANTTFTYTPDGWTNQDVSVTVSTIVEGFTLQTSKNGTDWESTNTQTYSENGPIYARLVDNTNQANGYAAGNVEKIDKEKPQIIEATASTNTINLNATDNLSGIIGYTVTTDTTEPISFTSCTNTKSLNVSPSGFTQGTTYYVWVKDQAGNVSNYKQVGTGNVTGLTQTNTTFTYSPDGWTNQDVTVTVSSTVEGFTLQTSKDAKNWYNTSTQTYSENGPVYARLVDSTNQANGYASGNVEKIDKQKPEVTEATASTNTIEIKATDEASGIIGYAVTTSTVQPTTFTPCTNTKSLNVNVGDREQGTTYYVWVKDEAGNISTSTSTSTGSILAANGAIKVNAENWNKTTHLASISFYKDETNYPETKNLNIQYKVEGKTDWTNGESAANLNHGNIISLRLSDGRNNGESTTYTVSAHNWDTGVITTQPTCTSTGIKTYTCTICGETKQETVAKLEHDINGGQGSTITAPTCISTGTAYYKCSKCGQDNTSTSARITLEKNGENHTNQVTRTATQKIDLYAYKDMDPATFNGYDSIACKQYKIFHFYLRNIKTDILIPGTNTILQTFAANELGGACGYYYCTNCGNVYCEYVDYKIYFNRSGNTSNVSQVTGGWANQGKVWELASSYNSSQMTIYHHWVNWEFDYTYCSGCGQYEYSNGHYEHR